MNIAVFASGNGSNFQRIAEEVKQGYLNCNLKLLVVDNPNAYVIERAKKFNIDTFVFNPKEFNSKKAYEELIYQKCRENSIDLIILAGYMRLIGDVLLAGYENKIINIHPSLLPAFKGKNAIEQAYEYGVKVMGISIHYVNQDLDGGAIIAQKAFEVNDMSFEEIEANIHKLEYELYPKVIKQLIEEDK